MSCAPFGRFRAFASSSDRSRRLDASIPGCGVGARRVDVPWSFRRRVADVVSFVEAFVASSAPAGPGSGAAPFPPAELRSSSSRLVGIYVGCSDCWIAAAASPEISNPTP